MDMLRTFFPSTDEGASLYGGFMLNPNCFCKVVDNKGKIEDSLIEINDFLMKNGYEKAIPLGFNDDLCYKFGVVSITPHNNHKQYIIEIQRDEQSLSQSEFLENELVKFRDERDWAQFHNSKDLSLAISIEASELLELFLWKNATDVNLDKIKEELADVFAYAFLLANKLDLNVEKLVLDKIKRNGEKYPVEKARGTAKKYDEL